MSYCTYALLNRTLPLKGTLYYEKALKLTPDEAVINKKFGEFLYMAGA